MVDLEEKKDKLSIGAKLVTDKGLDVQPDKSQQKNRPKEEQNRGKVCNNTTIL